MARNNNHDILFEPIKIGPKTSKNRFYQVPHCAGAGSERPGIQAGLRGMKAEGGWGVVCTEYCSISPESDDTPRTSARLWDDGDIQNLRHMCDTIHSHDALAGCQLWYGGVHGPNNESREVSIGPSPINSEFEFLKYCHAADEYDIKHLMDLYVAAAKRAVQAGFDIIYVYGAHGYGPLQWLSKFYNKRTDKYGGSFENRSRLWLEALENTRNAVDGQAAIAVRFSLDSLYGPDGVEVGDDSLRFIEVADDLVDLWDLNIGDIAEWGEDAGPSRFYEAGHQRPWTNEVKRISKKPIVGVSRETSPDEMAAHISQGRLDIIGAARPSIADPFLPKKIEEGRYDDIRECIGCNICASRWEMGAPMICTQNATSMEEYRRGWHPEKFAKSKDESMVLVVGGGPSGMECARVLGERGYDVHLRVVEKELGGRMHEILGYPQLSEWRRLVAYRETQLGKLKNVEVHLDVGDMTADDILEYGADKIVMATGGYWATDGSNCVTHDPVDGIDTSKPWIATPTQILLEGKDVGQKVVVLDGDGYFHGVSIAEYLRDMGKDVVIVTPFGSVGPYTHLTLEAPNLHRMMHEKGIHEHVLHWVENVEEGKLNAYYLYRDGYKRTSEPKTGEMPRRAGTDIKPIIFDTLVAVTGRLPNDVVFRELMSRKDEWESQEILGVYAIGECYAPMIIADAIFSGHRMAREFESPNPQRAQPYIRERQVWGHETFPKINDRMVHG